MVKEQKEGGGKNEDQSEDKLNRAGFVVVRSVKRMWEEEMAAAEEHKSFPRGGPCFRVFISFSKRCVGGGTVVELGPVKWPLSGRRGQFVCDKRQWSRCNAIDGEI